MLAALAVVFVLRNNSPQLPTTPQTTNNQPNSESNNKYTFTNPKKSAHYEANVPEHSAVLAGVPVNVVINFNFDLSKPSKIEILKDNVDYGSGETVIDENKLSMRRKIKRDAPDGLYSVKYNACWPDGSCHDGNFQFAIDQGQASQFSDQTSKKEVTIKMSQIKFVPQNVRVSKGTKVIWVNDDLAEHYVNTDPHPGHNYYPSQNSKLLKKGESYTLTFDQTGIYPYHCSAHYSSMMGSLLVE